MLIVLNTIIFFLFHLFLFIVLVFGIGSACDVGIWFGFEAVTVVVVTVVSGSLRSGSLEVRCTACSCLGAAS